MAIKASAAITLSSIRDLQSCTRYYLLQSSTSAKPAKPTAKPPGGNWVTAEPSYTAGSTNSLYFCDLNVFSDGDYAYSDVSLSSSYDGVFRFWFFGCCPASTPRSLPRMAGHSSTRYPDCASRR